MRVIGAQTDWRTALERAVLVAGLVLFWFIGYFGLGAVADPARARELGTGLDARIPFLPVTVWVYLAVFPAALFPVFVVRCLGLFRRAITAYLIVITLSLVCFAAVPVTSMDLRVDPGTLDVSRPSDWAVSVIYTLDPPFNLFPSLHLSVATLAALSAWKADRRYGAAAFVALAMIGVSICTVKQHFVVDGVAGIALAGVVGGAILGPYRPPGRTDPAYSWRGPALYAMLLILMYVGFGIAFLWSR